MNHRDHARACASSRAEGRHQGRIGTSRTELRTARSRALRQVVLLVGVGVVAAAGAQSAGATGWSIQPAPRPAHALDTDLLGVSCTSSRDCMAVGDSFSRSSDEPIPLVEHWNGTRWSIERTPLPSTPTWSGWLADVSCTSSSSCTAVGSFYTNAMGMGPLAERWNGSTWSIQRTPHAFGAWEFNGVSCASSTACIAVGNGPESFAERWDGTRWLLENIHFGDPQGRANALADVSCPSRDTCAAVGWDDIGRCANEYASDYEVPVLGLWTSGRWSLERRPNIDCSNSADNGGGNGLGAVSCTSTAICIAVGTGVYRWDGRRWTAQPAPTGTDQLFGVSCTSKSACTAVGSRGYTWNGHEWSSVPIPRPAQAKAGGLDSVSCTAPESCVAVGGYEDGRERDHLLIEAER